MSDKHVLIVDDARDILFLLTTTVKQLGPDYKVSAANDGYEALEQIRQKKFDLVITDYMMPGTRTGRGGAPAFTRDPGIANERL